MKLLLGHARRPQVSTQDILKAFSLIGYVSDSQPIAEVGKNWRIRRWHYDGRMFFPAA
jgi:hypothetical protein